MVLVRRQRALCVRGVEGEACTDRSRSLMYSSSMLAGVAARRSFEMAKVVKAWQGTSEDGSWVRKGGSPFLWPSKGWTMGVNGDSL